MSRRGRRRLLSAEERALWVHATREVKPLSVGPQPEAGEPPLPAPALAPPMEVPPEPPASPRAPAVTPKKARVPGLPLAPLEPKARRRLTRGAEVDARLDLHGMTQAAAHHRLRLFLVEAQALGHGVVLVITGKGELERLSGPALGEGRGVLRRAVPLWLSEPALRGVVLGFEAAGRRHGGEGALYVRIRKRRGAP